MAYLDLEPPEQAAWTRAASISLTVARAAGAKNAKLSHFMPDLSGPKEQTPLEQLAVIGSIADIPEHIRERFDRWQSKAQRQST